MAKAKTKRGRCVIVFVLQGVPKIITDDDGEPHVFESMEQGLDFTCTRHAGLSAAENIIILDCDTGHTETL